MIVLTGPSASGKTATCLYLQSHYGIKKVITHTTRKMRDGEVNDVDYHFVTEEEFERLKNEDAFIETVSFNGNHYGTSKKEVALDKCMAVEFNGAKTYKSFNDPKIVLFYMDLDQETCRERMLSRGDDPVKVKNRIENDKDCFILSDEMKKIIDVRVDTKKLNLEQAADFIYNKYIEILKKNGFELN